MKPSSHLRRLLRIEIPPDSSYGHMEISLQRLVDIVKSTAEREIRSGAVRKILGLFHSRGKQGKRLSLRYLSKIKKYVMEIETDIAPLFYSNDEEINAMGLMYIAMFPRFFAENDVVFYHVYRSRNKCRRRAMAALLSCSSKYRSLAGDAGVWKDVDLVNNLRTLSPDEYFGSLELSRLVELTALYPCLAVYFRFTSGFLSNEVRKGSYSDAVVRRIERLVGEEKEEPFYWKRFVLSLRCLSTGRYEEAQRIFEELSSLDISYKYRAIFRHFKDAVRGHAAGTSTPEDVHYFLSSSFELKLYGLKENKVYGLLRSLLSRSRRARSSA
jgi:hypothetical protein